MGIAHGVQYHDKQYTVLKMDPVDRQALTLAHNETMTLPYTLSLNKTAYNRVEFLLFNETVPGSPVTGNDRINASDRDLYLRVKVADPGISGTC